MRAKKSKITLNLVKQLYRDAVDCTSPNKQFGKLRAERNNKELENLNKILYQEVHLTKCFESSNRICKGYVNQTETRVNNIKEKIKRIEDKIYNKVMKIKEEQEHKQKRYTSHAPHVSLLKLSWISTQSGKE